MDELTAVRGAVDCLVSGALAPLIELLANDVEFEVASGGDAPGCRKDLGRQAVADYFDALGDLPGFWQMDEYSAIGGRVIAWGDESFTVEGCGLEGGSEFALVFDLRHGRVTRLVVVEDLAFLPGWDTAGAAVPVVASVPAGVRRRRALRDGVPTAAFAWWGRSAGAVADAHSEQVGAGSPA
jgi:ketosteroid isomerase-like protein